MMLTCPKCQEEFRRTRDNQKHRVSLCPRCERDTHPSPPPPDWRGIAERLYRIVVIAAPLVDDVEDEWWKEHEAAVKQYESARGAP